MPLDEGRKIDSSGEVPVERVLERMIENHRSLGYAFALLSAAVLANFVVPSERDVRPPALASVEGVDGGGSAR